MAKKAPVEELAEVIILLVRKFINWIYRQITGKDEELIKPPRIFKHGFSKKKILTNREFSFYKMLVSIVEPMGLRVFPKVRMIDIIETTNNVERDNRFWQNKQIIQMHVDFLLVDSVFIRPVCVIELDDSSHEQSNAKYRDAKKDEAFETANLVLLRVPAGNFSRPQVEQMLEGIC
jgi:very-short-patch-repair endonuclease